MSALRNQLSYPIQKLINLSFSTGIYPNQLKLARIVPIYKNKGDILDPGNYRPISCLNYIGKIFERCLTNRIVSFCDKFSLISHDQFGFQQNKSTCDALIHLTEIIYNALNDKNHNITILIDLQKAFDSVSHKILLSKLDLYGFRGLSLMNLLENYLTDRRSYIEIGSIKSRECKIGSGVPQGSIVSPILFVLFINDLPKCVPNFQSTLYADDTTLSISGKSSSELISNTNSELDLLLNWIDRNGLKINVNKTELLLFTNRKTSNFNQSISFAGNTINFVHSCKFLGVHLDDRLSFSDHIAFLVNKISKHTGILYKIRDKLPLKTRLDFYYSFIYSYLSFNVEVWGGT